MARGHFDFRSAILNLASDLGKAPFLLFFSDRFGSQGLGHSKPVLCSQPLSSTKPISQHPPETGIGNQKTGEGPGPTKEGSLKANARRCRSGTGVTREWEEEAGRKAEVERSNAVEVRYIWIH